MDNKAVNGLYLRWREAHRQKTEFWTANAQAWNGEVDATYQEMNAKAEVFFCEYAAAATGKTPDQFAHEMNERIHCRYD